MAAVIEEDLCSVPLKRLKACLLSGESPVSNQSTDCLLDRDSVIPSTSYHDDMNSKRHGRRSFQASDIGLSLALKEAYNNVYTKRSHSLGARRGPVPLPVCLAGVVLGSLTWAFGRRWDYLKTAGRRGAPLSKCLGALATTPGIHMPRRIHCDRLQFLQFDQLGVLEAGSLISALAAMCTDGTTVYR